MNTRTNLFATNFGRKKTLKNKFFALYEEKKGDWVAIEPILRETKGVTKKLLRDLKFTHDLSEWAEDKEQVVQLFQKEKTTNSLRDIALNYNRAALLQTLETVETEETEIDRPVLARQLAVRLYQKEPTAVLQRILGDTTETPVSNKLLSGNMATFLSRQAEDFNITRDSVYQAFKREDAFKDMDAEVVTAVKTELKALQRITAITPVPEALPVLMQRQMTSAFHISEMPEAQFIDAFAAEFGEDIESGRTIARQIHYNAANARIRNEQALIAMREVGQGTGIDFIDQSIYGAGIENRRNQLMYVEGREDGPMEHLSWDLLFSDADLCECGHCTSVYSAAAYFVELLQYLRNNNLDPANANNGPNSNMGPIGYENTPLEFLFNRRPDLGCLELTCENTNTLLPYVDLVNEVMENYVVYQETKAFNVVDETSGELLAQPQHTEFEAYCILHKTVYPFTLPYHQPIDATRIFLNFLKTSRYELLDTFRAPRKGKNDSDSLLPCDQNPLPIEDPAKKELLDQHHEAYLNRAVDAEYLGLTQEEYVILTKEAFVTKAYWDSQCDKEHLVTEYLDKIGVKPVHEYYGYETEEEMLSLDESKQLGLTFVKKQFLPRTGVEYTDLVDMLLTQFLNPNMPQGKARAIMESIQFSYRYLQSLVNESATSPDIKYKDLIEFLNDPGDALPTFKRAENPCKPKEEDPCLELTDIKRWVYCYFEQIGKIIVLENGAICKCPKGQFFWFDRAGNESDHRHFLNETGNLWMDDGKYYLDENCQVWAEGRVPDLDRDVREIIGHVNKNTGELILTKGTFEAIEEGGEIILRIGGEEYYNLVQDRFLHYRTRELLGCINSPAADNCDLDAVRLRHLDGSPLIVEEYDCFHRFIRLWRKLEWTIDETDKAIIGLGKTAADCPDELFDQSNCDDLFEEGVDCASGEGEEADCFNKTYLTPKCHITPDLLHQLVAVKKLLDKSGLEVIKLLTFWTNISTIGEKSLYRRLFLRHNVQALDPVFKADKNGLYLNGKDLNVKDHFPVLMAAFKLKTDDLHVILNLTNDATLHIENVSLFYRYRLLSKIIGEKIPAFIEVLTLFGDIFKDAHTTLDFMEHWLRMEDAGFSFRQLNYLLQDIDFDRRPFAPPQRAILQLAKTLYDGLNLIETTHQDIVEDTEITEALIRAKTSLLFDQSIIEKVLGLLMGTTIYTTNAPTNLNIDIPESLIKKLKYNRDSGTIQVTGILTTNIQIPNAIDELLTAKALDNNPEWSLAFDRIGKQVQKLFNEILADIFAQQTTTANQQIIVDAKEDILKGDIQIPLEDIPENQVDPNTIPQKQKAFLQVFMPYLRHRLTERFIVETLSDLTGLERPVVEVLIFKILQTGNPATPIYNIFESIKSNAQVVNTGWKGFLIPTTKEVYTFAVTNSNNAPNILINGQALVFHKQEDPTNEWWSDPIKLQSGKVYSLEVTGLSSDLKDLRWKTSVSAFSEIPTTALLPDYATDGTAEAITLLKKVAITVEDFILKEPELSYLYQNPADFAGLDFNALSLEQWFRLEAYTRLRNALSLDEQLLPEFFNWTKQPDNPLLLAEKIAELTLWDKEKISRLITEAHFNLNIPANFSNEINLLKLQQALEVADKIGMNIDLLFEWAKPTSHFNKTHKIAQDIQKAVRARYLQEDWEQVVRPLNDQLRNNQKNALISYLLVHPTLVKWGVTDADGLFEYFLIDVQMDACMETSRIKQAISSVQLFIQRCFLGLESKVPNDKLDRNRWDWMQRYRVWEANRKVFLYPENWIESNLRDDKSPFYKELESKLLQNDVNPQNVTDALKPYLYKVDEVANMEIVGLHIEGAKGGENWGQGSKLHVFGRTRNAPYFFYYRHLALDEANWNPWEKMQLDIPSYDVMDENGLLTGNGCYLTPYVWNGRLLVFFPQFMKKTMPLPSDSTISEQANVPASALKPIEYWEIKMGWSELRNGKWTQKQLSKEVVNDIPDIGLAMAIEEAHVAIKKAEADAEMSYTDLSQTIDILISNFDIINNAIIDFFVDDNDENKQRVRDARKALGDVIKNTDKLDTDVETARNKIAAAKQLLNEIEVNTIPHISKYLFVPSISNADNLIIRVIYGNDAISDIDGNKQVVVKGLFNFNGTYLKATSQNSNTTTNHYSDFFHHNTGFEIKSLQSNNSQFLFDDDVNGVTQYNSQNFYHPYISPLIGKLNTAPLKDFFGYNLEIPKADKPDAFGAYNQDGENSYHELKRPYSLYNWELFFHSPMMLANELSKAQQFEAAMKWYHYVFNPMAEGPDAKRFWQFCPFKETDGKDILESIFNSLQTNTANQTISEWRDKPFRPHLVARNRPVAYMKWTVMKYLDNLIDWGDYLFRQDTIENLNYATQLYVMASHILGKRPHFIPKRGKIQPQTYLSLLDKWDAFSNAEVELEIIAPYSNQINAPLGEVAGEPAFANIFGFGTSLYFCIPNNPKLLAYWDTIADRLFKIRHCMNIEGIVRKLPLFEPPIDPALLVRATAQGLSIASVLNDLNTPMPNYRFYYLLQKSLELCNEVKSLGNSMLSAMEKRDNERLTVLRAQHEHKIQGMVMEVRKQQWEEAQQSLKNLQHSRKRPENSYKFNAMLIGSEETEVPEETDYNVMEFYNKGVVREGEIPINPQEKLELDKAAEAHDLQDAIGKVEALGALLYYIPTYAMTASFLGVGANVEIGGPHFGAAVEALSRWMQTDAAEHVAASTRAGKTGQHVRQYQERISQLNLAGLEIKQIDKQILAQEIRIGIANQEITNQQQQIDHAKEIEDFLISQKYTNEVLFSWMKGQLRTLYHQVYNLAYELAKKAEKIYRFERGLSSSNFIQSGYWNTGREGLLAGENLYIGLKRMEAAWQEKKGHDYELTKNISLRQLNPLALLQLRATGKCEFALSEMLFDMDFPNHYQRRIKSVSMSIPCVVGPYTSINANLRLLNHKYRTSNIAKNKNDYPENLEEADERFLTHHIPIESIAVSSAQNDSGLFELNFRDDRYLPFEGAGAVSQWRIELPTEVRQFDYNTINDVIIHLRYTSKEGGERMKIAANETVREYVKSVEELGQQEGLFAIIDLKHDLSNEWHKAFHIAPIEGTARIFDLNKVKEFMPYSAKFKNGQPRAEKDILVSDVQLITSADLQASNLMLKQASKEIAFTKSINIGDHQYFVIRGEAIALNDWKLSFTNPMLEIENAFLIVRLLLK